MVAQRVTIRSLSLRLDAEGRETYVIRPVGGRRSMVDPQIVVLVVAGSSPVGHPTSLFLTDTRES